MSEKEIATRLKKIGYRHVIQFRKDGNLLGMPLFFKDPGKVGPFMREDPRIEMVWTKPVDEYIQSLTD